MIVTWFWKTDQIVTFDIMRNTDFKQLATYHDNEKFYYHDNDKNHLSMRLSHFFNYCTVLIHSIVNGL